MLVWLHFAQIVPSISLLGYYEKIITFQQNMCFIFIVHRENFSAIKMTKGRFSSERPDKMFLHFTRVKYTAEKFPSLRISSDFDTQAIKHYFSRPL